MVLINNTIMETAFNKISAPTGGIIPGNAINTNVNPIDH